MLLPHPTTSSFFVPFSTERREQVITSVIGTAQWQYLLYILTLGPVSREQQQTSYNCLLENMLNFLCRVTWTNDRTNRVQYLPQLSSSLPSVQSRSPSQRQEDEIHCPLLHLHWELVHAAKIKLCDMQFTFPRVHFIRKKRYIHCPLLHLHPEHVATEMNASPSLAQEVKSRWSCHSFIPRSHPYSVQLH